MKLLLLALLPFSLAAATENTIEEKATPFRITVSDHLLVTSSEDATSGEKSSKVMHEDLIQAEYGDLGASLHFTNSYVAEGIGTTNPIQIEKASATLETGDFKFEAGDSYQEMGRGIALSLYKDDLFSLNTTLLGASGKYEGDVIESKLFVGKIHTLQNPVGINPAPDPLGGTRNVYITGASSTFKVAKKTKVGGHYLLALERLDTPKRRPFSESWHTFGLTFAQDDIFEDVDLYVEGNGLLRYEEYLDGMIEQPGGFGTYASLIWTPSPFEVKLEAKNYRDYEWEFNRAPTLEHDVVETEHPNNIWGTRLMVSHRNIRAKSKYFGSFLLGGDRVVNADIYHGVVGAKFRGPAKTEWTLDGGYRDLPGYSNLAHASIKGKIRTGKGQSLEIGAQKQLSNEQLQLIPTVEDRNKFDLTYTFSKSFQATLGYEFVPSNETTSPHFASLALTYKAGSLAANAFLGQTSGGTQCSGGVCRQVPPFSGGRVETVYSF